MIVGEPPGDDQRFWAEGNSMCLPNSKMCVWYARGLHDLRRGCDGEFACYDGVVPTAVPLHVRSLRPDIVVTPTFRDYLRRRDEVMDVIVADQSR